MPTMTGHFAVFDQWTEIDSMWEGNFMERLAPGCFAKTFAENRDSMKVTFNHGHDPTLGDKVLGPINSLEEDAVGAAYDVPLLDTSYNRDLLPGLEADLYGASFRFRVIREEIDNDPGVSSHNPGGIPERTIKEVEVFEFGPVTFPAYAMATAGTRSMTDEFIFDGFTENPKRLVELIENVRALKKPADKPPAPSETAPAKATPEPERRDPAPKTARTEDAVDTDTVNIDRFATPADMTNRLTEIASRFETLNTEYASRELGAEQQAEWDQLKAERAALEARIKHLAERQADVERQAANGAKERVGQEPERFNTSRKPENLFDMASVRRESRTRDEEERTLRDHAKRVVETAVFPHPEADRDAVRTHIERLIGTVDENTALSRRILATGSELYSRAFGKYLRSAPMTEAERAALAQPEEIERALSLSSAGGGFAIPFQLDPTILPTSNGAVNPFRAISRVEQITVDEWRGVSSAGITASYAAEATETTDNSPTLAQPVVSTEKAQAFIPFSIEVGMDWGGLQSEMATLLQDAKDELEATKFVTGTGTNEPFGVITGATTTVDAGAGGTFTIANLYSLIEALPPRFRARANIVANQTIFNKTRQFDTTGGSSLWFDNLTLATVGVDGRNGRLPQDLLGFPAYEASAMSSVTTVGELFAIIGDFSRYYLIADRIGLTVEVIPHLVGTNHRPTGQRGLYAYWRNGAKVLNANAFRVLIGLA